MISYASQKVQQCTHAMKVVECFYSFGLLQPFLPVFWPTSEEQESEGGAPICPTFHEVPYRFADDGAHERCPKTPEGHPEKRGADGFQEDERRERYVYEADAEQQRSRDIHIGDAEQGKPFHPRLLALQREDAVAEELAGNGDAQDPLDVPSMHDDTVCDRLSRNKLERLRAYHLYSNSVASALLPLHVSTDMEKKKGSRGDAIGDTPDLDTENNAEDRSQNAEEESRPPLIAKEIETHKPCRRDNPIDAGIPEEMIGGEEG